MEGFRFVFVFVCFLAACRPLRLLFFFPLFFGTRNGVCACRACTSNELTTRSSVPSSSEPRRIRMPRVVMRRQRDAASVPVIPCARLGSREPRTKESVRQITTSVCAKSPGGLLYYRRVCILPASSSSFSSTPLPPPPSLPSSRRSFGKPPPPRPVYGIFLSCERTSRSRGTSRARLRTPDH